MATDIWLIYKNMFFKKYVTCLTYFYECYDTVIYLGLTGLQIGMYE